MTTTTTTDTARSLVRFMIFYDSLRNIYVLGIEGISLRTEVVLSLSSVSPPQLVCYGFIWRARLVRSVSTTREKMQ